MQTENRPFEGYEGYECSFTEFRKTFGDREVTRYNRSETFLEREGINVLKGNVFRDIKKLSAERK